MLLLNCFHDVPTSFLILSYPPEMQHRTNTLVTGQYIKKEASKSSQLKLVVILPSPPPREYMTKKPYFCFSWHFFTDWLFCLIREFKKDMEVLQKFITKTYCFSHYFATKPWAIWMKQKIWIIVSYKKLACLESHTEKREISLAILLNIEKTSL